MKGKDSPLEGGYKGFFMEESLRKAGSSNVPTSRNIDQLKKGAEGVQRARGFAPFKPPAKQNPFIRRGGEGSPRATAKPLGISTNNK